MREDEFQHETSAELGEEFRQELLRKIEDAVKERMGQKIENFFQNNFNSQDINDIADKAFSLVLEGRSMADASELIRESAVKLVRTNR